MARWIWGLKWGAGIVVGTAVLFTAVMGFAHTKPGRPLLVALRPLMGMTGAKCPLGYDAPANPAQRELARQNFSRSHAGAKPARGRPALGFTLDQTQRADVLAWSKQHGVRCEKPRSGVDLECSAIPAALLPEGFAGADVKSLWLTFGEGDRLISMVAFRRGPDAAALGSAFDQLTGRLEKDAGAIFKRTGTGAPQTLTGLLNQSSSEFRFTNYFALARVTNMGQDGFVLTEEYRSLVPVAPRAQPLD